MFIGQITACRHCRMMIKMVWRGVRPAAPGKQTADLARLLEALLKRIMSCLAAVCVVLRKQLKYARHCIPPNNRVLVLKTIHLLLKLLAHDCSFQTVGACIKACRVCVLMLGKRFTAYVVELEFPTRVSKPLSRTQGRNARHRSVATSALNFVVRQAVLETAAADRTGCSSFHCVSKSETPTTLVGARLLDLR